MLNRFLRKTALAISLFSASAAHAATELTMYYPIAVGGPLTTVMDGLIGEFEKGHPEIKVKAVYSGNYDETRVRALSALKGGQPAQLSVLGALDTYDLIDQGLIEPFDTLATTPADRAWLQGFYPGLMANGTIGGHVWGIPFQRSTLVMFYNKDMFRAAGLNPDAPPRTWKEMVAAATRLSGNGKYGLMIPSTGYPYWMFQAFAIQNGVELMNKEGTQVSFNSPAAIEALEFWRALAATHKVMPAGAIEWGTLRQAFVQGQTAMMWHTTGNLTAVRQEAKFDFGVAMLPANKQPGSPVGGGNFYLFKGATAAQKTASLTFVRWMTAPERAARWSIATGYVGTSPAAYDTAALRDYTKTFPQALVARDQLAVAVPEFSTEQTARVREVLSNAIQAALTGTKTPKQAMDEAQAAAERLLKPYR
ncbi:ABC transporter substrate-binding protein [Herbaspirillum sp. alder98]|uniref:ABC transporter substrate-binding protein n=1 Tax=Herbaspirillum sp. alder98 TaxID=2913096 RepID=UPI001CD89DF6|nr:ABC transporter substrate-binding protein [Herbaspirillum sp. alder98]MCA1324344.1 ABC transporter substrate-binding protein [Herbaspirillum sp. alder98]